MTKRMNEFIYLHESEKEREKRVRSMVKKKCVMCSGERKWVKSILKFYNFNKRDINLNKKK